MDLTRAISEWLEAKNCTLQAMLEKIDHNVPGKTRDWKSKFPSQFIDVMTDRYGHLLDQDGKRDLGGIRFYYDVQISCSRKYDVFHSPPEVLPTYMKVEAKGELNKKSHSVVILCLSNKVLREVIRETTTTGVWTKLDTEEEVVYILHVLFASLMTHMDKDIFQNSTIFDPARFETSPPSYSYVPFGAGPRMCLGIELAKMETLDMMHRLVTSFRWELVNKEESSKRIPMPEFDQGLLVTITPI
nr:cytochrome P450 716B1-like [Tanacetum cinerariifolium]